MAPRDEPDVSTHDPEDRANWGCDRDLSCGQGYGHTGPCVPIGGQ